MAVDFVSAGRQSMAFAEALEAGDQAIPATQTFIAGFLLKQSFRIALVILVGSNASGHGSSGRPQIEMNLPQPQSAWLPAPNRRV
jgi:hypothetical protein